MNSTDTSAQAATSVTPAGLLPPAQFKAKYGPWAVISGASDGTGAAFAQQLAALGLNLVLIARREKPLAELAARLAKATNVQIKTLQIDLSEPGAADRILAATAPYEVGLYVSNAGSDTSGAHFVDRPIQGWRELIQRNVITLTEACHGFLQKMLPRGRGGLLLMGSGAGMGGQPRLAIYSATKGFDVNFAESLWAELRGRGIDVLSVMAPPMNTETLQKVTQARGIKAAGLIEPADVALKALTELPRGPTCVFSSGFDPLGPDELAESRRRRVVAVSEATKMFYGEA